MTHRLREAMKDGSLPPMGGDGGIVEIDETFIGNKEGARSVVATGTRTRS